jgi:hypothetical protein
MSGKINYKDVYEKSVSDFNRGWELGSKSDTSCPEDESDDFKDGFRSRNYFILLEQVKSLGNDLTKLSLSKGEKVKLLNSLHNFIKIDPCDITFYKNRCVQLEESIDRYEEIQSEMLKCSADLSKDIDRLSYELSLRDSEIIKLKEVIKGLKSTCVSLISGNSIFRKLLKFSIEKNGIESVSKTLSVTNETLKGILSAFKIE